MVTSQRYIDISACNIATFQTIARVLPNIAMGYIFFAMEKNKSTVFTTWEYICDPLGSPMSFCTQQAEHDYCLFNSKIIIALKLCQPETNSIDR